MTEAPALAPDCATEAGSCASAGDERFSTIPFAQRAWLGVTCAAATMLPFVAGRVGIDHTAHPVWLTLLLLVGVSALNVEIGRAVSGGLVRHHQPHKALSSWAFAAVLLLPPPYLLLVVALTYAHARWRGLRIPLWKWVGSGCFMVLAALAATTTRHLVRPDTVNWMDGNGGLGLVAIVVAAVTFLAAEGLLFGAHAWLGRAEDEEWLRRTITSPGFYATEAGVLLIGGLLAAVWTGGSWFVLFCLPIYALVQRAALLEPLRERAAVAAELAETNRRLELTNQFKVDLMGMLGHEIGNPLTSVVGFAQVGSDSLAAGDADGARRAFTVVERSGSQIRTVLGEILTMVSSDRDALTAVPAVVELRPHLEAVLATRSRGRAPDVVCPPGLTAYVQASHLDQILANLLSNADKYAGGPTRLSARPVDGDRVEVVVEDAGPGVGPAFQERLFARFSRSAETAADVIGTGLGLFITRELARANGGEITYQGRTPSGSTFVVTLPRSEHHTAAGHR